MEDLSEAADEMKEFSASVDTILMGRKTYEKCLEFGRNSYNGFVNYVFTKSKRESLKENVKFISSDVREFIENLKRQKVKTFGCWSAVKSLKSFLKRI